MKKKKLKERILRLEAEFIALEDRVLKMDNHEKWKSRQLFKAMIENSKERIEQDIYGETPWKSVSLTYGDPTSKKEEAK